MTDIESALGVFKEYVAVKLSFKPGDSRSVSAKNLNFSSDTLLARSDAFMFVRVAEQYTKREDRIQRLVSLFKNNPSAWIGDLFSLDQQKIHSRRMVVIGSLSYVFRTDIERIVDHMSSNGLSLRGLLLPDGGNAPRLIQDQEDIIGGVQDETLALLHRALGFASRETADPLWNLRASILRKYSRWLSMDKDVLFKAVGTLTEVH